MVHYGIAKPRSDGDVFEIEDLVEKPSPDEAPSNLAIAARYVFAPAIFDALDPTPPGKGDEIQLTDAIRSVIQGGGKVFGVRLRSGEWRFDIGNFESYFQAFVEFALADPRVRRRRSVHTWSDCSMFLTRKRAYCAGRAGRQSVRRLPRQDDLDHRPQLLGGGRPLRVGHGGHRPGQDDRAASRRSMTSRRTCGCTATTAASG